MSPELQRALLALYDTWWNKVVTLDSANDKYSFISWQDVQAMDEAAELVAEMLDG